MMRYAVSAVFLLVTTHAIAEPSCGKGSTAPLTVVDWSAKKQEVPKGAPDELMENEFYKDLVAGGTTLTVSVQNNLDQDTHMVDAGIFLEDALGYGSGSGYQLKRDLNIPAGTSKAISMNVRGDFDRLRELKMSDVILYICTRAVLFEDGTKQEF